jgi:hypothetical protein
MPLLFFFCFRGKVNKKDMNPAISDGKNNPDTGHGDFLNDK